MRLMACNAVRPIGSGGHNALLFGKNRHFLTILEQLDELAQIVPLSWERIEDC